MSLEKPWEDAPVAADDSAPWKSAPTADEPWKAAPVADPSDGATITASPTITGELGKGNVGNALGMAYENTRRVFSGLMGPTEAERTEQAIPWGTNPDGSTKYEYKPLGDRMTREAGLFTPFLKVDPMKAEAGDSKLTATGKGLFNVAAGVEGGLLSPGGVLLPVGAEAQGLTVPNRIISGAFGADMLGHVKDQVKQGLTAPDFQGKLEGWLGAITSLGMGYAATKRAVSGGKAAETPGEAAPVPVDAQKTVDEVVKAAPDEVLSTVAADPTFQKEAHPEVKEAVATELAARQAKAEEAAKMAAASLPETGKALSEPPALPAETAAPVSEAPPAPASAPESARFTAHDGPQQVGDVEYPRAIKVNGGEPIVGESHTDLHTKALEDAAARGEPVPKVERGFVDKDGNWLNTLDIARQRMANDRRLADELAVKERAQTRTRPLSLTEIDDALQFAPSEADFNSVGKAPSSITFERGGVKVGVQNTQEALRALRAKQPAEIAADSAAKPAGDLPTELVSDVATKTPEVLAAEKARENARRVKMQQKQDVRVGARRRLVAPEEIRPENDLLDPKYNEEDLFNAEKAYRDEALAEHHEASGTTQYELLSSVRELGGLPGKSSRHYASASGELERVFSALDARGRLANSNHERIPLIGMRSKYASSLDTLREALNGRGFNFETPYDLLDALEKRIVSGDPHYGSSDPQTGFNLFPGASHIDEIKGARFTMGAELYNGLTDNEGNPPTRDRWEAAFARTHPEIAESAGPDLDEAWRQSKAAAEAYNEAGGRKPMAETVRQMLAGEPARISSATGIKNDETAADLRASRLPAAQQRLRTTNRQSFDDAIARMEDDPQALSALVDRLEKNPGAPVDHVENMMLMYRWNDLQLRTRAMIEHAARLEAEGDIFGLDDLRDDEARLTEENLRLAQVLRDTGTATAQALQSRKAMIADDYSLLGIKTRAALAKGEPLSKEEAAAFAEMSDAHAKLTAELETVRAAFEEEKAKRHAAETLVRELKAAGREVKPKPERPPRDYAPKKPLGEKVVAYADKVAAEALKRIRAKLTQQLGSMPDVSVIADAVVYGAAKLTKGAIKFGKWSGEMAAELGDWVKPHLRDMWVQAKAHLKVFESEAGRDIEGERRATIDGIKARLAEGDTMEDMGRYARALARQFIEQGITELEPLNAAVHTALAEAVPGITPTEARDAWTGYGKFTPLDTDPVNVRLREVSTEGQKVSTIERLQQGLAGKKTGRERQPPTDKARALDKEAKELARRLGISTTDPATQLKSSLDAIKTRLRNEIADMDFARSTGKRLIDNRSTVAYDAEAAALKTARDAAKAEYDKVFPKEPITPEEALRRATALAKRNLESWEAKLADAKAGKFEGKPAKVKLTSPEIDALDAQAKAAREEVATLRDLDTNLQETRKDAALQKANDALRDLLARGDIVPKEPTPRLGPATAKRAGLLAERDALKKHLQGLRESAGVFDAKLNERTRASLEKSIADLDSRLQAGDLSARTKGARTDTPENEALRAQRDAMTALLNELRDAAKPRKTALEIALQAKKTRMLNRIAELAKKRRESDFEPAPKRPPVVLDPAGLKIEAALKRVEAKYQSDLAKYRLARRTGLEKTVDAATGWNRAFKLSRVKTLLKLATYSIFKLVHTPLYEATGAIYQMIPGYRELAARAPVEGKFSGPALRKFYSGFFGKGMSDAAANFAPILSLLTRGRRGDIAGMSDLKALYGRKDSAYGPATSAPHELYDIPQILHEVEKSPLRRASFEMAAEKGFAHAHENGRDITAPDVQEDILRQAYKAADRSVLLADNKWADAINRGISSLEAPDKVTGKVTPQGKIGAAVLRSVATFNRVASNHFVETFVNHVLGFGIGNVRFLAALKKGIGELHPEDANSIMRQLKQGTPGAAAVLLGMLYPQIFGGLDPRKKRGGDEPQFGEIKVGGVTIPRLATMANPMLLAAQLGATITQTANSKRRKSDAGNRGMLSGVLAGAAVAAEAGPVVNEGTRVGKLFDENQREQYVVDYLRNNLEPGLLDELATALDKGPDGETVKRKASTLKEQIELGIPGLRQDVPERPHH